MREKIRTRRRAGQLASKHRREWSPECACLATSASQLPQNLGCAHLGRQGLSVCAGDGTLVSYPGPSPQALAAIGFRVVPHAANISTVGMSPSLLPADQLALARSYPICLARYPRKNDSIGPQRGCFAILRAMVHRAGRMLRGIGSAGSPIDEVKDV